MPRPSSDDAARMYVEAQQLRSPQEPDWRMAAAYCTPWDYKHWNSAGAAVQQAAVGTDARRFAYDNSGVNAVPKYCAVVQRMATPDGQRWVSLQPSNPALNRIHAVRGYYDAINDLLFTMRYDPRARFTQGTGEMYESIAVYGGGPIRVGWRKPKPGDRGGLGYRAIPMRDYFITLDDEGNKYCDYVRFYLTARQFQQKFGDETPPPSIARELAKAVPSDSTYFEFVHMVHPRGMDSYDPSALDYRRFTYVSSWLCVQDKVYVGKELGYRGSPYLFPRAATPAGGAYGISPAMRALPALGSANATKKTILKQGQKAVDPAYLAHDDGVLSGKVDIRPGKVTYGGVDSQGRMLVRAMEQGNFQVAETILADERNDIGEPFFTPFFKMLVEHPEMTAAEVYERAAKETSLAAPTMGRLQSEYIGPDVDRELAVIAENAPWLMPEPPPEVIEAQGEFQLVYTSPMARNLSAEEDAGFTRMVETSIAIAQATGDPSHLDHYKFDVALPEMAAHRNVPARWMVTPEELQATRDERKKQQQTDQLVKAGPSIASVATATMKNKTGGVPAAA